MLSSPGTGVRHLGDVMRVLGIKPGSLQEQPEPTLQLLRGLCHSSKGAKLSSQHPNQEAHSCLCLSSSGSDDLFWPLWAPIAHTGALNIQISKNLKTQRVSGKEPATWQHSPPPCGLKREGGNTGAVGTIQFQNKEKLNFVSLSRMKEPVKKLWYQASQEPGFKKARLHLTLKSQGDLLIETEKQGLCLFLYKYSAQTVFTTTEEGEQRRDCPWKQQPD